MSTKRLSELREWKFLQEMHPMLLWAIPNLISHLEDSVNDDVDSQVTNMKLRSRREFWIYEVKKTALSAIHTQELVEKDLQRCRSQLQHVLSAIEEMLKESICCEDALNDAADYQVASSERQYSAPMISKYGSIYLLAAVHESCIPDEEKTRILTTAVQLQISLVIPGFKPLEALTSCNMCLESIFRPCRDLKDPWTQTTPTEVESMGLDISIAPFAEAALQNLHYHILTCKNPPGHRILLQLSGFQTEAAFQNAPMLALLLSTCQLPQSWQETYIKKSPYGARKPHSLSAPSYVKQLCERIATARTRGEAMQLLVEGGFRILEESVQGDKALLLPSNEPNISLVDALRRGLFKRLSQQGLTNAVPTRDKRRLALSIARSFMYLYPSGWTSKGWSSDEILFLSSIGDVTDKDGLDCIPFVPCAFPTTRPPSPIGLHEAVDAASSSGGSLAVETDILLLGKILLEMECGNEILPERLPDASEASLFLALDRVIEELEGNTQAHYISAVEGCLELHRRLSSMSLAERTQDGQRMIYDAVVCHLEKEFLTWRRPNKKRRLPDVTDEGPAKQKPRHELSEKPKKGLSWQKHRLIDSLNAKLTRWQKLPGLSKADNPGTVNEVYLSKHCLPGGNSSCAPESAENEPRKRQMDSALVGTLYLSSGAGLGSPKLVEEEVNQITLFDDLASTENSKSAKTFLKSCAKFFEKYLDPLEDDESPLARPHDRPQGNVRVCIIDTGVQKGNPDLQGALLDGRFKEGYSWLDEEDPTNVTDTFGHGTHVAALLARVAPRADLYIAKVADSRTTQPGQVAFISNAIWKATDEWKVDIIVMSLGLSAWDNQIHKAIKHAANNSVIMLAAASNHGSNEPRTFPATHRDVICVHASDGNGGGVSFNPLPQDDDHNFSTLGASVPLIWNGFPVSKSGTSFATPVAAGFAVNALEVVTRQAIIPPERIFCGEGMRELFYLMSIKPEHSGYRYLAPWHLWRPSRQIHLTAGLIKEHFGVVR
ncbi:hypothetical protein MAPG_04316 [Magnaporthiopsis poae ATCC 64411]|uniref:Uncharacterized protein n=1 Tax=Magnaporthiopsis poae (strain ATCC 64411 / 73-15) TaxID=644358 RepID=A0A0C4DWE0_MAGP6|nr:hypothetical protein MAPG_04316 [Magnaporthiopsis poae ATCC 64411]